MAETSEETLFNQIRENIRETGDLTDAHHRRLTELLGGRFTAAYDALKDQRVKEYIFRPSGRVVWIVVGKERDYQILPLANFCSCPDFYFRVIDHETCFCYHLIAQKLAHVLGRFVVVEETDARFSTLMEKWRKINSRKRELPIILVKTIRNAVWEILCEQKELSITCLLEELQKAGFHPLTTKHLANILIADKAKRFSYNKGLWALRQTH